MKARMVRSPPVEARSRALAGCAYKRRRIVSFRPSSLENGRGDSHPPFLQRSYFGDRMI